jgi:hypothetical protein
MTETYECIVFKVIRRSHLTLSHSIKVSDIFSLQYVFYYLIVRPHIPMENPKSYQDYPLQL